MSGTAIGLIAAAAVLLGTGCCGGLLYGLFRKFREDKDKKNKIIPDEEVSTNIRFRKKNDYNITILTMYVQVHLILMREICFFFLKHGGQN